MGGQTERGDRRQEGDSGEEPERRHWDQDHPADGEDEAERHEGETDLGDETSEANFPRRDGRCHGLCFAIAHCFFSSAWNGPRWRLPVSLDCASRAAGSLPELSAALPSAACSSDSGRRCRRMRPTFPRGERAWTGGSRSTRGEAGFGVAMSSSRGVRHQRGGSRRPACAGHRADDASCAVPEATRHMCIQVTYFAFEAGLKDWAPEVHGRGAIAPRSQDSFIHRGGSGARRSSLPLRR